MKSLKEKLVQEGLIRKQGRMDLKPKIESWMNMCGIKKYTINNDLTIDVNGDVNLMGYPEEKLPEYIQFRKARYFEIYNCPNLKSLKGCPKEVGMDFYCHDCPELESLEGAPQEVGRSFWCNGCPNLESLEGAPQRVPGDFYCHNCKNLKSLKGCPKEVGRSFWCNDCPKLESLEGAPQEVGRNFWCTSCGVKFNGDDIRKSSNVKGKIIA